MRTRPLWWDAMRFTPCLVLASVALCEAGTAQAVAAFHGAFSGIAKEWPDAEAQAKDDSDAALEVWGKKARAVRCHGDEEECMIETMALTKNTVTPQTTLTQINRGRLGNHLFQWAAMISIAKEAGFRVVVRDLKYKPKDTAQMRGLAPLVLTLQDYAELEIQSNLCHVWDRPPIVIDTNLPRLGMWTGWGQDKGDFHLATGINPQYGQNWAKLFAGAMKDAQLPNGTHCEIWELDGFFQQQWFFADHINLVRRAFWHEPSAEQAAEVLKWLMYNEKGASVGIHIRLGDYKYTNRNMPMQYYKDALVEVQKRNAGMSLCCVLFSDDIKEAIEMAEGLELCAKRLPVPQDLGEVHSFYMLGLMPNIIIADSSYSFWAARLSPSEPFVVAPAVHKDSSQAESAYEYLMQTPGWVNINTTTDMIDKVEKLMPVSMLARGRGRTVSHIDSTDRFKYEEFQSEWAY